MHGCIFYLYFISFTPYQSHCEEEGSDLPDLGISPYDPAAGSRSSSLGFHCNETRSFLKHAGTVISERIQLFETGVFNHNLKE